MLLDFGIDRLKPGQVDRFSLSSSILILFGLQYYAPVWRETVSSTNRLGRKLPGGIRPNALVSERTQMGPHHAPGKPASLPFDLPNGAATLPRSRELTQDR